MYWETEDIGVHSHIKVKGTSDDMIAIGLPESLAKYMVDQHNQVLDTVLDSFRKILVGMHNDGTICRDHYNPSRGTPCSDRHNSWCDALCAWDAIEDQLQKSSVPEGDF